MTDAGSGSDAEDDDLPPESRDEEEDWALAPDSDAEFTPDERRREFVRQLAEDVRGESSESKQLSAILYRVSDLYDPDEDTSPEEIYLNVRRIMQIKERGGLKRE
ncbi:hypothetical protein [Halorarum salinum]|uniref:Uncharacterized protein n=1 Tax=Halorarum salinum TaxID=2743089 RepID=A0A7D5LCH5_9EURY|nr:hypothetical protein [Halobaculum salinum]QLG62709.1 hypothetical protein HUG12_13620 [Halobaculum salinum]